MRGKKKKSPKIKKVALLITPSREHTRGLLNGIIRYARIQGDWSFRRPIAYRLPKSGQELLPILKEMKPDGILMREPKNIMKIIKLGIPTVTFSYSRERFPNIVNVITDNAGVGKMGAEHLLKCGFRKFAFCGFDDWWWSRLRGQTFAKTITDAGYETYFYKLPRAKSKRTWHKEVTIIADWLRSLPRPVGLMACNDDRGELVLEACKIAGLNVPQEVAVMGVDNDKLICDLSVPPLSSIVLNIEKTGYDAAALLNRMMKGENVEKTDMYIRLLHVVQRHSTDTLAIDDPDVAKAIRYIRDHATNSICVSDVVDAVLLSRRVLEKHFRKVLKHSIHDEIRQTRIEKIVHLLSETQMSISQIAQTMDFRCVTHLSRYFRKVKGVGPAAYRKLYIRD